MLLEEVFLWVEDFAEVDFVELVLVVLDLVVLAYADGMASVAIKIKANCKYKGLIARKNHLNRKPRLQQEMRQLVSRFAELKGMYPDMLQERVPAG